MNIRQMGAMTANIGVFGLYQHSQCYFSQSRPDGPKAGLILVETLCI